MIIEEEEKKLEGEWMVKKTVYDSKLIKQKLIEQNKLNNFIPQNQRVKRETSEDKTLKKNWTFKPNLEATKKMNLILEVQEKINNLKEFSSNPSSLRQRKHSQIHPSSSTQRRFLNRTKSHMYNYTSNSKHTPTIQNRSVFKVDLAGNSNLIFVIIFSFNLFK